MSDLANKPIYPIPVENDIDIDGRIRNGFGGITLREHYAGLAMQGVLANPHESSARMKTEDIASCAVIYADALIAELSK